MKHLIIVLSFVLFQSLNPLLAQESGKGDNLEWFTSLLKANEKSIASKKPIFAFFTGSDWCGWCRKLQAEVFAKPAFVKWAKEKVILLELDFPRMKQLPAEIAQQNQGLQQAFNVQGYPTVWLFTAAPDPATQKLIITPLGSLGYPQGAQPGREELKFLTDANSVLDKSKAQ